MIRSLYTAATGMDAQQTKMDTIANNLANANTTGFKKSRADFEDLMSETIRAPQQIDPRGGTQPERTSSTDEASVKARGSSASARVSTSRSQPAGTRSTIRFLNHMGAAFLREKSREYARSAKPAASRRTARLECVRPQCRVPT